MLPGLWCTRVVPMSLWTDGCWCWSVHWCWRISESNENKLVRLPLNRIQQIFMIILIVMVQVFEWVCLFLKEAGFFQP